MRNSNSKSRSLTSRTFVTLALLIATLLTSAGSIYAAPGGGNGKTDPQTPLRSDGVVVAHPKGNAKSSQQESFSAPAEGSGVLEAGRAATASDPAVTPMAAPTTEAGPESVIGTDSRYQITDTTAYPYRAIVFITFTQQGGNYSCTGWLISPDTVATAGHCVAAGGSGSGWSSNVVVSPGRNGSYIPYGSCGYRYLNTVYGWINSGNRDYDYGTIKLNCSIGNTVGWFGFRWQSASLAGDPTYISGYPGDKAYATQWRSDDYVRISYDRRIYYANDSFGGQSGAPVWDNNSGCYPCGIAIHAYSIDSTGYNGGTRINSEVFNNLVNWKNTP